MHELRMPDNVYAVGMQAIMQIACAKVVAKVYQNCTASCHLHSFTCACMSNGICASAL